MASEEDVVYSPQMPREVRRVTWAAVIAGAITTASLWLATVWATGVAGETLGYASGYPLLTGVLGVPTTIVLSIVAGRGGGRNRGIAIACAVALLTPLAFILIANGIYDVRH